MKAKRVSSQIFIDKSKPLSRLTQPIITSERSHRPVTALKNPDSRMKLCES